MSLLSSAPRPELPARAAVAVEVPPGWGAVDPALMRQARPGDPTQVARNLPDVGLRATRVRLYPEVTIGGLPLVVLETTPCRPRRELLASQRLSGRAGG